MSLIGNMKRAAGTVAGECREWFERLFIAYLPGRIGILARRLYWSPQFLRCRSFIISYGCRVTNPKGITMGDRVNIMHNCCLYANDNGTIKIGNGVNMNSNVIIGAANDGEIILGDNVAIGPNVVLRASNHIYGRKDIPINKQGHTGGRIVVEDDVWIGANAVVLRNVTIGKGAVIGAGAVVNRDIPPGALACGVPAKVIKADCRG
ncbi:MAG: DapH/DapD/GlmU-related protein [Candidatus Omnitrophota bacterium]|jgi:galactoside O-acetyltransferase